MVRIVECFADNGDDVPLDQSERAVLKICGEGKDGVRPRERGCPQRTPTRTQWNFSDDFAGLFVVCVDEDKMDVAIVFRLHTDDAAGERKPPELVSRSTRTPWDHAGAGPAEHLRRRNRANIPRISWRFRRIGFRAPARDAVVIVARTF